MTALRLGRAPFIPFASIKAGRPVLAQHAYAIAQGVNERALQGNTLFFNPCRQTLTASGGTVTSGLFRHKVPLSRFGYYRIWVVAYSTEDATLGGRIKITPTIAPAAGSALGEASHPEWADGKYVETLVVAGVRRFRSNLYFIERVDTGSYTLPSEAHDLSYTITWELTTSGGSDLLLHHVACYEVDSPGFVAGNTYGIDPVDLRPFSAIWTGSSNGDDTGVRQIAAEVDRIKEERRRFLWCTAYPATALATSSSHDYSDIFAVSPRVHPFRRRRGNPAYVGIDDDTARDGWAVTHVRIRAYGQNSDTVDGALVITGAYSSAALNGFPIGSYGWVVVDLLTYCESTIQDLAGTPTEHGFQKGLAAGPDTVAEESDRSSALDDRWRFEIRGKSSAGRPANTVTIRTIQAVQEQAL